MLAPVSPQCQIDASWSAVGASGGSKDLGVRVGELGVGWSRKVEPVEPPDPMLSVGLKNQTQLLQSVPVKLKAQDGGNSLRPLHPFFG